MITYKDQCWCTQDCGNLKCIRNYTDEQHDRNVNGPDLPLSLADMKTDDCGYEASSEVSADCRLQSRLIEVRK